MAGNSKFGGASKSVSGVIIGSVMLAGCVDGELNLPFEMPSFGSSEPEQVSIVANEGVPFEERDVEAPEEFSLTDQGLWDGRPSLGGIWIAHADVGEPARVRVRNTATGQEIIGALFRRERDNPGPAIQVSSDAAVELGMIAGNPQSLEVVALRRETVAAPTAPDPAFEAADTVAAGPPAAITSAPIDAAAGTADSLDIAPPVSAGPLDASAVPLSATEQPDPLAGAAAAIDAAEANSFLATSSSQGAPQPYVLVGVYSAASNAQNAAEQITDRRLPARVVEGEDQGSTVYRVLVGPASSQEAQIAVLSDVQQMGFTDAYFVPE